jgi:CRP/FNR family transcriptional regulator, anaerobic regulatory protein
MQSATALEPNVPLRKVTFVKPRPERATVRSPTLCSACTLRSVCLPRGLQQRDAVHFDQLIYSRRRVLRGEHLYRTGDAFSSLYAFRLGFFKSYIDTSDGQSQVIGFPMAGDVVGMDGIETDRHRLSVVALEDGEVCVIPYAHFLAVMVRIPALQHQLYKMMSHEIVREQALIALVGGMRAESRVAAFLLALSEKFAARGYSSLQFHLRMSREEIGSHLGLKLETVSRVLSRFHDRGLVKAHLRSITIVDQSGLKAVSLGLSTGEAITATI